MTDWIEQISTHCQGDLQQNVSMQRFNSWRVGGAAKFLYKPKNSADLQQFLKIIPIDMPLAFVGLGSNLLVLDEGYPGVVVLTHGCLTELKQISQTVIYAQAGVACAKFAKFTAKQNLIQGAFFAGIPGTIGGALKMNAGAFGGETWQQVDKVVVIDRAGNIFEREPQDFKIRYREIEMPNKQEWFLAGYFHFQQGDGAQAIAEIQKLLRTRSQTQPTALPSCGSVFRNPPENFAAKLIENSGLKGYTLGDAMVSDKHANFIINKGEATAKEIEQLMSLITETVKQKFGVELQREVHTLGFDSQ